MLGNSLRTLKVLDFTQVAAGPACTMMLGDLGAQIVKIEPPTGDLSRALYPFLADESINFMALNRNKRSMMLDLKNDAHRRVALKLAREVDVVVESFRPGVMEKLSLGYADLAKLNPSLIYCSISAYGQEGPCRSQPGVDGVLQAVTGLMSITGLPDGPPCKIQIPLVDMATGNMASIAILAALMKRERDGGGQHLDISMYASAIGLQHMGFANYFATLQIPAPLGSAAPYAAPNEALRCQDGWLMVAAYHPARWQAICEVLDVSALLSDPRFETANNRIVHRHALIGLLEEKTIKRPRSEWLELLRAADVICGPINNYQETAESEQFAAASMAETVSHPVSGALRMPRFGLREVGETPSARYPAPRLGEHTREILGEHGFSSDQIEDLLRASSASPSTCAQE